MIHEVSSPLVACRVWIPKEDLYYSCKCLYTQLRSQRKTTVANITMYVYDSRYRKIPIISHGLIKLFVQKAFLLAYFWGSLFSEGFIIGRTFAFQNGLDLTIKTA